MTIKKSVFVIPIVQVLITAMLALWLGEEGGWSLNLYGLAGCLVLLVVIAYLVRGHLVFLLLSVLIFLGAFFAGRSNYEHAFKQCMEHGESLRQDLAHYKHQHGHYPAELDEVHTAVPGELLLRPGLMYYQRTANGYELSFRDWLMSYSASESKPFEAHK